MEYHSKHQRPKYEGRNGKRVLGSLIGVALHDEYAVQQPKYDKKRAYINGLEEEVASFVRREVAIEPHSR